MTLLNKLTIKNLKLNQKRTIVTIIGIILSVAMLTAVASMFFSARASLIAYQIEKNGDYHYSFKDVPKEDVETFRLNRKIEEIYLTENLGYAKLNGIQNEYKPYLYVKGFTKDAFDALSISLVEGRFPENENEIAIPEHLKENGGVEIKVGEKITLNIGRRVSEGHEQNQNNPYDETLAEEIVDAQSYEYEVVGIIKRLSMEVEPYSAPGYTCLTCKAEDSMNGSVDVYARYAKDDLKNHLYTTANILEVDEEAFATLYGSDELWEFSEEELNALYDKVGQVIYPDYTWNDTLLMLETGILKEPTLQVLAIAGLIVVAIIIFTSIYCIKNSFDISITEKIRQYGMLASIGATRRQIKRNVYYEAMILGAAGIPLGILSGLFASYVLIHVSDYFMKDLVGLNMIFSFSWTAVILSVLLGFITVLLSARKSAVKASKIAPIQAIRNSDEIKITAKGIKTPKWVGKLFGIGGEISYKNLQRSKKKYRTTVTSIVVCVMVFISVSSFVDLAFETVKIQYKDYEYNMMVGYGSREGIEEKIDEIFELEHIEECSNQVSTTLRFTTDKYTEEYKEFMFADSDAMKNAAFEDSVSVHVLDNQSFKNYTEELGLDFEEARDKGILVNTIYANKYIEEKNQSVEVQMEEFTYKSGDTISGYVEMETEEGQTEKKNVDIKLAAVTDKVPFGMNSYLNWGNLIVGEDYKEEIIDSSYHGYVYMNSSNTTETREDLSELLKDYQISVSDFEEAVRSEESLFTLIAIFLYGFITVIALIGVTNIFNTITTNMNLRRREFAMLKSVGMTEKEFRRMIQLESLFYGMKSLLIGIPIGCVLSYIIYRVLTGGSVIIKYQLPVSAILISVIAVLLLVTVIMRYSMNKINKQNIIETIRNENI